MIVKVENLKNVTDLYLPFVAKQYLKDNFNDDKENVKIIALGDSREELESFCKSLGYHICNSPLDEGIIIARTSYQDPRKSIYNSKDIV